MLEINFFHNESCLSASSTCYWTFQFQDNVAVRHFTKDESDAAELEYVQCQNVYKP